MKKISVFFSLIILFAATMAGVKKMPEPLNTLISNIDRVQAETATMKAQFTQEKRSSLLKGKGDTTRGMFYISKPDKLLLHYESPKSAYYLISDNSLLVYYPELKVAQKANLRGHRLFKKALKYFGMGESIRGIADYFNITLTDDSSPNGNYYLKMIPAKRRLEKYVEEVNLRISKDTYLPRRVEIIEDDGDSITITLDKIERNIKLDGVFDITLPPDVRVEQAKEIEFIGL